MFNYVKSSVVIQLAMMLVLCSLILSPLHAKDMRAIWQAKAAPIKVIGVTADGKYPIYDLVGDETDTAYRAGSVLFTSGDLVNKLVFLAPADVDKGVYTCEFICKDQKQRTVGINPSFKFLLKK